MVATPFPTTHWSLIQCLATERPEKASAALESLCLRYRTPLVKYLIASGASPEDADDIVQEFFAHFIRKGNFQRADRERGRLRTFLLTSLSNFANRVADKRAAAKRGGGREILAIDALPPDEEEIAADWVSPADVMDREWARAVMSDSLERLGHEYETSGKAEWFPVLVKFLEWRPHAVPYAPVAKELGVRVNRVALEVFHLRRRFREIIREEVGRTVLDPKDIEEELRYLAGAVDSPSMAG